MKRIDFNIIAHSLKKPSIESVLLFGVLEKNVRYTFAGKSALALLLRWYRGSGVLRDRSDELLVPQWLGAPVYAAIHPYCFPTTTMNERVRGVMAYHQWGFPQNMDVLHDFCRKKKLFLIEDCAHAFDSYYHGGRVGTTGDAAFFSLSKFFPSVEGGAIYTKKSSLMHFVDAAIVADHNETLAQNIFNNRIAYDNTPTTQNLLELTRNYIVYDQVVRCPDYSLAVARQEIATGAIERRRRNYARYLEAFGHEINLSRLAQERVLPWVVPVFLPDQSHEKAVTALQNAGIKTDTYHFDVNRNMLNPHFVPCVPLPCHQGLTEEDIARIISVLKKAL